MSLTNTKRLVIKVGSALIAPQQDGCKARYLLNIAQFIVRARTQGVEVLLVSSGSVAAGAHYFKNPDRSNIAMKKAMAAAGQMEMMSTWDRFFDFPSAQLLLTHADLKDKERYNSIRQTIFSLLDEGILPIINENDAITTEHLKVGDNDNLSAMVAAAADADTLLICSDVDGLYDQNPKTHPNAQLIKEVNTITSAIYDMTGGPNSAVGTGGMRTKLEAAEKATSHGIATYIINGFNENTFNALLQGDNPGTLFTPFEKPMEESQHWMTHTAAEHGELIVGSETIDKNEELNCEEILSIEGEFSAGETVLIKNTKGERLAKASSNYSSCLLNFITQNTDGINTSQMQNSIGPIISKNDIAVLERKQS